jgi:hypothetical protein
MEPRPTLVRAIRNLEAPSPEHVSEAILYYVRLVERAWGVRCRHLGWWIETVIPCRSRSASALGSGSRSSMRPQVASRKRKARNGEGRASVTRHTL